MFIFNCFFFTKYQGVGGWRQPFSSQKTAAEGNIYGEMDVHHTKYESNLQHSVLCSFARTTL